MPGSALSKPEFIALIAAMFATVAFSVDAMLPALPEIAADLSPLAPNRAQLILTSFMFGLGFGTFLAGPLSDAHGRRPVMYGGLALYVAGALWASVAPSLEMMLAARVLQGLGAAGPRVVALAIVRDLYKGRDMARIVSLAFVIFTLFPAVAPAIGAGIVAQAGWRAIFFVFAVFGTVIALWLMRQPETLPPDRRRPLTVRGLSAAIREMAGHVSIRYSTVVQSLVFGILFSMLSSVQQVYAVTFGAGDTFPYWFGAVALVAGTSGFVNARLVNQLGIRFIVTNAMAVQIAASAVVAVAFSSGIATGDAGFALFLIWQTLVFFQIGMSIGNLNALAMEPVGHIAGTAASVLGAVATVSGVLLAVPVGLAFDGTPVPLACGIGVFSATGFWLMRRLLRLERVAAAAP